MTTFRDPLDSDEDLPSIHPVEDEPEDDEDRDALEHRRIDRSEAVKHVLSEMDLDSLADGSSHDLPHDIERDRIQPGDGQRECPAFPSAQVDERYEPREEKCHQPSAEERPARSPDLLYDGADSGELDGFSEREPADARDDEALQLFGDPVEKEKRNRKPFRMSFSFFVFRFSDL